ncbi:hypothetical protein QC762_0022270 [Podospora pseudocomata]|uniref:Uncharacterized protein n=1 Tax=Podospora pseudocomata TaxID=2093779 RepID=A0ABR0GY77_9PEZI|nr:hypothetical protein QC762_0022270 [Podospora pseudocomata]
MKEVSLLYLPIKDLNNPLLLEEIRECTTCLRKRGFFMGIQGSTTFYVFIRGSLLSTLSFPSLLPVK